MPLSQYLCCVFLKIYLLVSTFYSLLCAMCLAWVPHGMAFHHGGLSYRDRTNVQALFVAGHLQLVWYVGIGFCCFHLQSAFAQCFRESTFIYISCTGATFRVSGFSNARVFKA